MTVTFDDAVPEEARAGLAKSIPRAYEVGLPIKSLVTAKPGAPPNRRTLTKEWRIVYKITMDEKGDFHVTVDEGD